MAVSRRKDFGQPPYPHINFAHLYSISCEPELDCLNLECLSDFKKENRMVAKWKMCPSLPVVAFPNAAHMQQIRLMLNACQILVSALSVNHLFSSEGQNHRVVLQHFPSSRLALYGFPSFFVMFSQFLLFSDIVCTVFGPFFSHIPLCACVSMFSMVIHLLV